MEEKGNKKRGAPQNMKPPRTKEEAKSRGKNGGIASGEARRKIKSIREALKLYLSEATTVETDEGRETVTNAFAIAIAAAEKAKVGDVQAMTFVRDSVGEKPKDTVGLSADEGKIDVSIQIVDGNGNKA